MPKKVAYEDFESDPEWEYEFYLARRLGRTVKELRASLDQDEFIRWQVYDGRVAQRKELESMKVGG